MTYATKNAEILALLPAIGKDIPHEDSDMGRAVQILQTICDSQSHTIPDIVEFDPDLHQSADEVEEENKGNLSDILEALEELENNIGEEDFTLDFDGNEYRIISESDIWDIYIETIQELVEDCYSDVLNLDKIPSFIAISVDWVETAKNTYADGYGHTFSKYDGSEEEAAGYYIFRTN